MVKLVGGGSVIIRATPSSSVTLMTVVVVLTVVTVVTVLTVVTILTVGTEVTVVTVVAVVAVVIVVIVATVAGCTEGRKAALVVRSYNRKSCNITTLRLAPDCVTVGALLHK